MRLLKVSNTGDLAVPHDFVGDIPRYAILSHTWGPDEVSYLDLANADYKTKAGYRKLRFCNYQALSDGIEYFWADTCCIDKSSSTELTEAINSHFRWYQNSAVCYVHLSDVTSQPLKLNHDSFPKTVETQFRNSRWFTRCWTLQELIAPKRVEFFSYGGKHLGTRDSLQQQIHQVTGIPIAVLNGEPLSSFSVQDRMQWANGRQTTRIEDRAYSLLGLFDVQMPLLYGEGDKAFVRLKEGVDREQQRAVKKPDQDLIPTGSPSSCYTNLAETEFRLFVLDPGRKGGIITGTLKQFSLLDCPPYYALSYVWGQEPKIHRIIINGETHFIQPNLLHALLRIRPATGQYYIWVDALCINQDNHVERSRQVKQMGAIYGRASGVWIWLGEESSTSATAMKLISEILSDKFKWNNSWWNQHGLSALAEILDRPWFRRGWVIQEVAFSTTAELRCGDQTVHMIHFMMVVNMVRNKLGDVPPSTGAVFTNFHDSAAIRLLDIIRDVFGASNNGAKLRRRRLSLERLVDLTTSTETSDERDSIYALLNLANDMTNKPPPNGPETIVPDYQKGTLDVFVDFILHCCTYWGSLDIICRPWAPVASSSTDTANHANHHSSERPKFPSWIASRDNLPFGNPSLRSKNRLHGNPFVGRSRKASYYAHYGTKPQVSIGRTATGACDGFLSAKGILLGEIGRVSARIADAIVSKESLEILLTGSEIHTDNAELPDVIWRTLCADRDENCQRAPHSYSSALLHLLINQCDSDSDTCSLDPTVPGHLLKSLTSIDVDEISQQDLPEIVEEYLKVVRTATWNRRTFRSKMKDEQDRAFVGLVPRHAKAGDHLCILYGCSVPVVLRQSKEDTSWFLIGDAYIHGAMDGEMISSVSLDRKQEMEIDFRIK